MSDQAMATVGMLCRCPQCGAENRLVFDWNNPRKYSKCQGCGEVIPTGAYKVQSLSNDRKNPIF